MAHYIWLDKARQTCYSGDMKLTKSIREYFLTHKNPRFRDGRGHYASALTSDMRDLYWAATGTPETNPTDLQGAVRMFLGKAVEEALTAHVFANLHFFGIHFYMCEQIPVGASDPAVNGFLDGMARERLPDGSLSAPVVVEIKTKQGYGADLFLNDFNPGENYLAQIGYYLYVTNKRGITNEGRLLFVLLSDKHYGEIVEICVRYNAEIDEVRAYEARHIDGRVVPIDYTIKLQPLLDRLKVLDEYVAKKELPPAEHFYKYPLTPEFLASVSDTNLKRAIEGQKVLGDWQISYSRYKDLHIKAEGATMGYTDAEIEMLKDEYRRRVPATRKYKKVGG